jgi:hypothetical protein
LALLLGTFLAPRDVVAAAGLLAGLPSEVSELVTHAVRADAREDWNAALELYARAEAALIEAEERQRSPAQRLMADKVDQERRASLRLLELCGRARPCAAHDEGPLEAARLLRRKVVLIANRGEPLPLAVAEHARALLRRMAEAPGAATSRAGAETAAVERCALEAAVGDRTRARRVLARVPRAARALPALAASMAACRAALGENREAIRLLVTAFGELPPPSDDAGPDLGGAWRELYLLDDWQTLRGDAAFEALFGPAAQTAGEGAEIAPVSASHDGAPRLVAEAFGNAKVARWKHLDRRRFGC